MNEFNFRVANAAPRASGFEIGKNVGDIQTTYIYSYKTKYINGRWSSITSFVLPSSSTIINL